MLPYNTGEYSQNKTKKPGIDQSGVFVECKTKFIFVLQPLCENISSFVTTRLGHHRLPPPCIKFFKQNLLLYMTVR